MFALTTAALAAELALLAATAAVLATYYLRRHLRALEASQQDDVGQQVYKGERNRIRLSIASTRTNALGLGIVAAVILLVGASQIGLEAWRHYTAESVTLSTSRLEELLQKRLPDPEVQQSQHQEIVKAIRDRSVPVDNDSIRAELAELQSKVAKLEKMPGKSDKPEVVVKPPPVISWFASLLNGITLFGVFFLVAAAWIALNILRSGGLIQNKFYRAATASLALGLGGVTLVKDSSLVKDVDALFKFDVSLGANVENSRGPRGRQGLRGPQGRSGSTILLSPELACGIDNSQRVEPFGDGQETLEESGKEKLKTVIRHLKAEASGRVISGFMLVGSADKRPLKNDLARRYGSNDGLARARVKMVKDSLEGEFPGKPIMGLHTGPSNTGMRLSYGDLAFDRAVHVCAFWGPKN